MRINIEIANVVTNTWERVTDRAMMAASLFNRGGCRGPVAGEDCSDEVAATRHIETMHLETAVCGQCEWTDERCWEKSAE